MPSGDPQVLIITTGHWAGDARLRRHARYLGEGGIRAEIAAREPGGRIGRLFGVLPAMVRAITTPASVVIFPDPELYLISALVRLTGKRTVLDIHEDYAKTARTRDWIPRIARRFVAVLASLNDRLARVMASRVMVAAPELARPGDLVVPNIPDPSDFTPSPLGDDLRLVYVGDVSVTRGVHQMIESVSIVDGMLLDLIGPVPEHLKTSLIELAERLGVADRVKLLGRLAHEEAWAVADGAVAGLCLLSDVPAYRHAVATKIWEYMAAGIPPVVSDLPGQAAVVGNIDPSLVCQSPTAVAATVRKLITDTSFRDRVITAGTSTVAEMWERYRPDLAIREAVAP